ncbi:MAG: hypothetical protein PHU42_00195 [Patescibacteria group bacterium]|nr:hypothetical protein [Patescibacteria group bacterium]
MRVETHCSFLLPAELAAANVICDLVTKAMCDVMDEFPYLADLRDQFKMELVGTTSGVKPYIRVFFLTNSELNAIEKIMWRLEEYEIEYVPLAAFKPAGSTVTLRP